MMTHVCSSSRRSPEIRWDGPRQFRSISPDDAAAIQYADTAADITASDRVQHKRFVQMGSYSVLV